jgi:hypothetical protein
MAFGTGLTILFNKQLFITGWKNKALFRGKYFWISRRYLFKSMYYLILVWEFA